MTTLLSCLLITILLPILAKGPLAVAMFRASNGRYDNRHPRSVQANLTGFGARAKAAHENSFEALTMFAPAALAAVAVGATGETVQTAAILFVIMRISYIISYLQDWDKVRSTVWFIGLASTVLIMIKAIMATV